MVISPFRCSFCGGPIDNPDAAYVQVTGWEKPGRGAGGKSGSSLVLRERTGKLACSSCILRHRERISIEQGALL